MENLVLGVGVVNGGAKQFPASSSLGGQVHSAT